MPHDHQSEFSLSADSAAGGGATRPGDVHGGTGNSTFARLEAMLAEPGRKGPPPVERWEPAALSDIGMAIAADGSWSYQGSVIARPALVRLFASVLRKDADGATYLVTPTEKVIVRVADAPFLAVEMEVRGVGADQRLVFRSNVDDIVVAGSAHPIRFVGDPQSEGVKPYILVRGRLEALVTRALYYDLVALAVDREIGGRLHLGVWSEGCYFPIARWDEIGRGFAD